MGFVLNHLVPLPSSTPKRLIGVMFQERFIFLGGAESIKKSGSHKCISYLPDKYFHTLSFSLKQYDKKLTDVK
jgi:hypothetical protein